MSTDGVTFSSLETELFDGAGVTKGELVAYLEAMADRVLPALRGRALSVVRARPGQAPFMQKNLPAHAPDWIATTTEWAGASKREVRYPMADDARTLLWLANQRAVELHPALVLAATRHQTHLVIDLDPAEGDDVQAGFRQAVACAGRVREVLDAAGLRAAVKTTGSKGLHLLVPLTDDHDVEAVAAATRAIAVRAAGLDPAVGTTEYVKERREGRVFIDSTRAGGSTLAAVYSPRARPGVPVSCPVRWEDLDDVVPADLTVRTVPALLGVSDPWAEAMPQAQRLPDDLVGEGAAIPVARVQAMHEGKRRRRAAG